MALDEVDRLEWANGPHSERLARLQPLFPGGGRDVARRLPTAEVAAAVRAVVPTARRHWREIIAEADPERAAFRLRAWHAEPGCCLLCGNPGSDADKRFQGDVIHTACRPLMAAIGPAFGQLVLDEVLNIQNEMAQPQVIGIDPTADPDDSSTWL